MTDLYEQIRTAVQERLKLAEAAASGVPGWRFDDRSSDGPSVHTGAGAWNADILDAVWHCDDEMDGCPAEARAYIREGQFIAANSPDLVARAARADLARLERHSPIPTPRYQSEPVLVCDHCSDLCHSTSGLLCGDPDAPWPCVEIRELAEVYGIEVSP